MSNLLPIGAIAAFFLLLPRKSNAVESDTVKIDTREMPANPTRGERNNNPGNIRFNSAYKWQGQVGEDSGGYLVFDNAGNGIRAVARDLLTKYRRGLDTVGKIIAVYAPEFENPTAAYATKVASDVGVTVGAKINLENPDQLWRLVSAMIRFENGRVSYTPAFIYDNAKRAY